MERRVVEVEQVEVHLYENQVCLFIQIDKYGSVMTTHWALQPCRGATASVTSQ